MNVIDLTLQRSMPSVMVPKREAIEPMATNGERLLIAANGVFIEIRRSWLRLVRRVATYSVATAIPYGDVDEQTQLVCGAIPASLVGGFATMARAAFPKETGAWIVWSPTSGNFRLVPVEIRTHDERSLDYVPPRLELDEQLVVDCHSHGREPAFFSPTDDGDDEHEVKLALVVGNCSAPTPSVVMRLCAKGIFEHLERVPCAWYEAIAKEAA
ncbi:PRTRC system protein A [Paraburkholderia agricolaris]|jgi:PRTRC genetic system protein A|uniref:PRTRC system protein A n=1 Tax=Paraburkholderia agricolaris TaxID=2152888 RepID=A0ABW8ZXI8_9BURK